MLAGCAYKEGDVYYLFYSAAGNGDIESWHEGIGLATSTDGLHWQRYSTKNLSNQRILTLGTVSRNTVYTKGKNMTIFNGAIPILLRMKKQVITICISVHT